MCKEIWLVTFIFAGMRRSWVYTKVKPGQQLLLDLSRRQGCILGDCLAVMTDSFAPKVLSIKADKISSAVTVGLKCGCFGTGNNLHLPSNVAWYYYEVETTTLLPCLNSTCAVTWNNPRFLTLKIDIASNAHVSEFPPLAVPALMLSKSHTLPRTRRSCFVIFRFMARRQSPITMFRFAVSG